MKTEDFMERTGYPKKGNTYKPNLLNDIATILNSKGELVDWDILNKIVVHIHQNYIPLKLLESVLVEREKPDEEHYGIHESYIRDLHFTVGFNRAVKEFQQVLQDWQGSKEGSDN